MSQERRENRSSLIALKAGEDVGHSHKTGVLCHLLEECRDVGTHASKKLLKESAMLENSEDPR